MKRLLKHRRFLIALHIAIALAMVPGVMLLENDNSPDVFFSQDAIALEQYNQFCRTFRGGQAIRVAIEGDTIWTSNGLNWIAGFEEQAAQLDGVETVIGLATQYRWMVLDWPPVDIPAFRQKVITERNETGAGWISPDGNTVTTVVVYSPISSSEQKQLLNQLEKICSSAPHGIRAHLSGMPVFHLAMDQSLVKMATVFLPLLVLLAALFLLIIFRRKGDVFVPLFFVAVFQSILFGIMGYAGIRINLVNIILAPLLFVISLATAAHLFVHYRGQVQKGKTSFEAVESTYSTKQKPVLWTALTTFVAFGSLVTGNVPVIRTVGIWSAVGIVIMTVLVFTFYPLLLAGIQKSPVLETPRPFELRARKNGRKWAHGAILRRPIILTVTILMIVLALLGFTKLRVEDNIGTYFSPQHPVRAELERLQQQQIGVFAAELILTRSPGSESLLNKKGVRLEKATSTQEAQPVDEVGQQTEGEEPEESGFHNPKDQQQLGKLSAQLRSLPIILGAIGSGDLVKAAIRSFWVEGEITGNTWWMALGIVQTAPESRRLYQHMISADGLSARITLLVPMLSFNQLHPVFRQVEQDAKELFPKTEAWITGQYPLILLAQQRLLKGLIISLSVTILCVALVFAALLRNLRLTLLVLIPNLWPIILVLGGMGWLGIPLDSASVMTVSIVLGLAVDDTFHTLGQFRRLKPRYGPNEAIETTLEQTAPAHILTSIILIAGFTACFFSDLLPVSRMGALSAIAIFLALVGDLFLIPALLAHKQAR